MSKTETVFFEKPATGIFSEDAPCEKAAIKAAHMPINGYKGYIVPGDDAAALAAGGAASAADGGKVRSEKFSRIAALLADILIPNLMKEEYFV